MEFEKTLESKTHMKQIGKLIKDTRISLDMTQVALGKKTKTSKQYISAIENNKTSGMTITTLTRLVKDGFDKTLTITIK